MTTGLTLYSWSTPNGQKPIILLEELGVAYRLVGVDLGRGHQLTSRYLDINPQGKVPTLVDRRDDEVIQLSESGAIMIYLAEREGRFLPRSGRCRFDTLQWLMYQSSTVSPTLEEINYVRRAAPEPIPFALERYMALTRRVYCLVDQRLSDREFIAEDYSIADMALFPWLHVPAWFGLTASEFPNVDRWRRSMSNRPAVQATLKTCFAADRWEEPPIAV